VFDLSKKDDSLLKETARVAEEIKGNGLNGLVGGLQAVIINTEPQNQVAAVQEMLDFSGLSLDTAFEDSHRKTLVLKTAGSADFLVTSRKDGNNPFASLNTATKAAHLPNTRLETFVFSTPDIEKYVAIQKNRGIKFLTDDIEENPDYLFVQTQPSPYTNNSLGFIQWKNGKGNYRRNSGDAIDAKLQKPAKKHLSDIHYLDHAATRVTAQDRDAAIIEFVELTNYRFDFAIYVKTLNSITSVARLSAKDFAMVFTSGIAPFDPKKDSGPTERFIRNYGRRVHHIAFQTENIDKTKAALTTLVTINKNAAMIVTAIVRFDNGKVFSKRKQENIMSEDKKSKMWINRIVAMIIAGGLMFLVMNFTVAGKLRKELDSIKYEPTTLLNDARAYYENEDYDRAKETLNTLFEKRPGSDEAVEGKELYTQMETAQKELDARWEAAVGGIREEWVKAMVIQLREQLNEKAVTEKEELERDMNDILDKEWEKVKDTIREEWEKQK